MGKECHPPVSLCDVSTQSLPLRRDEAAARASLLKIEDYDVRLDLGSSEETFGSVTTIRFTSRGGPTFLDLKPVSVERISLNGASIDPATLAKGRLPISAASTRPTDGPTSTGCASWTPPRRSSPASTSPT
jgi:aminopeptidase N